MGAYTCILKLNVFWWPSTPQLPGHGCDRNSYLKDHEIETYLIVPGDTYRQVSSSEEAGTDKVSSRCCCRRRGCCLFAHFVIYGYLLKFNVYLYSCIQSSSSSSACRQPQKVYIKLLLNSDICSGVQQCSWRGVELNEFIIREIQIMRRTQRKLSYIWSCEPHDFSYFFAMWISLLLLSGVAVVGLFSWGELLIIRLLFFAAQTT